MNNLAVISLSLGYNVAQRGDNVHAIMHRHVSACSWGHFILHVFKDHYC